MRLFIISFVIALLCVLPEWADVRNWTLPAFLPMLLKIPATGMGYMEVFFHELGHTAAYWLYGQPAVPAFNFQDGGGVSLPIMDRSIFLQGIVYALTAYLAWLLWSDGYYGLLLALAAVTLVQICFAFGERYQLVVSYMGHGGSILVGCFCLVRAALNKTYSENSPVGERYLNMTFGLYALLHNLMMSWNLLTDDLSRQVYEQGIGGHITNDFVVIADTLNTNLQHVGGFSMGFIAVCLIVSCGVILWCKKTAALEGQELGKNLR